MRATFLDHQARAWQAFCSTFYWELLWLGQRDPNYRQGKTKPQFVVEEYLYVMEPELLELDATKIMDVRGVAFHLFQLEVHLRLGQDLLLVEADDPGFLTEFSRAAAPARPDTKSHAINWKSGSRDYIDHPHEGLHAVDFATDIFA
jgi:hypothetical protein